MALEANTECRDETKKHIKDTHAGEATAVVE